MVCDHCHGHGLPCDESPICEQCQMGETACVHRLCEISPDSRADCTREECRYAHRDHLPRPSQSAELRKRDYIIYDGVLRPYLNDGRVPFLTWASVGVQDWAAFDQALFNRQKSARRNFETWLLEGHGSPAEHYYYCGKLCGQTRNDREARDERRRDCDAYYSDSTEDDSNGEEAEGGVDAGSWDEWEEGERVAFEESW